MNTSDFANKYLQPFKIKGDEVNAKWCPLCQRDRPGKGDHYKFFMNAETGTYYCHRQNECGVKGSFKDLCDKFGEQTDESIQWKENKAQERQDKKEKTYKKQVQRIEIKTDEIAEYMKLRKISEQTYIDREVAGENGNIVFPYRNKKDDIVLIKYRPARKVKKGELKYWQAGGGKPILWGENYIDTEKPLIITEGEFDTLSIDEAFECRTNTVSVPFGSQNFEWVDLCWDWLRKVKKIILCCDNDDAGLKMQSDLIKKLGEETCCCVSIPDGIKDINELLFKKGKEAVVSLIEKAEPVPVDGLIDAGTYFEESIKTKKHIKTPFSELNKLIAGLALGELSVFTGYSGNGKSTMMGQILLEALNNDYSVCAYSGELTTDRFLTWIDIQAAGRNHLSMYDQYGGTKRPFVERKILIKIKEWYKKRLYLYDNTLNVENTKNTGILKLFRYAARRHNCKLFLVDNLMTAHYQGENERDFHRAQSQFVGELVHFSQYFNVHTIIVAHPRKQMAGKKLTADEIAGTAEIRNRADNIFSIEAASEKEIETNNINAKLVMIKNRETWGESCKKVVGLCFSQDCKRFWQVSAPEELHKKYGWEDL